MMGWRESDTWKSEIMGIYAATRIIASKTPAAGAVFLLSATHHHYGRTAPDAKRLAVKIQQISDNRSKVRV